MRCINHVSLKQTKSFIDHHIGVVAEAWGKYRVIRLTQGTGKVVRLGVEGVEKIHAQRSNDIQKVFNAEQHLTASYSMRMRKKNLIRLFMRLLRLYQIFAHARPCARISIVVDLYISTKKKK